MDSQDIKPPQTGGQIVLHKHVIQALPVPGTTVKVALRYGKSLWGQAVKIETVLPSGEPVDYLLKLILNPVAKTMVIGEYESVKAIHDILPDFVPKAHAWGQYTEDGKETYFILVEFRLVGKQPPDPVKFTTKLAELHKKSVSPTGKFGFHVVTYNGKVPQATNQWSDSWSEVYQKLLGYMVEQDLKQNGLWPEFKVLCDITLEKVIPRLCEPLQSDGRFIKPCLVHGDLWDENTATDLRTDEPFTFDPGSMYAHNEYEIGNWRAIRHRLSNKTYVREYKNNFPASEPEEEWEWRNMLYSLRYNLCAAILFPGSVRRKDVFDDMKTLCKNFFPDLLKSRMERLQKFDQDGVMTRGHQGAGAGDTDEDAEEEEEEEEAEEER